MPAQVRHEDGTSTAVHNDRVHAVPVEGGFPAGERFADAHVVDPDAARRQMRMGGDEYLQILRTGPQQVIAPFVRIKNLSSWRMPVEPGHGVDRREGRRTAP